MPSLKTANKLYVGGSTVSKVYAGSNLVWSPPVVGGAPATALITAFTPGADRTDYTGELGMRFTVGTSALPIQWLGVRKATGNTGTVRVDLYNWSTGISERNAIIDVSGATVGNFAWGAISPITLTANAQYGVLATVLTGGNMWSSDGATTARSPETVDVRDGYKPSGGVLASNDMVGRQFVGVNVGWDAPAGPAFGTLLGTLSMFATTTATQNNATGTSFAVKVGDLIFVNIGQQSSVTSTSVTDNLGNTYTFLSAGHDAGSITGRAAYSIVTVAGTLTTVSSVGTSTGNTISLGVAAFAGPFTAIDKNPATIQSDITSPYTCPLTGTLAAAAELVIGYADAVGATGTWSASAPSQMAVYVSHTVRCATSYRVTAATTSISPEFTSTTASSPVMLGTVSFR